MQQQETAEQDEQMDIEPAHVMKREKHLRREHYERMAHEAEASPEKTAASMRGPKKLLQGETNRS